MSYEPVIRIPRPEDRNFIFSLWLLSYRKSSWFRDVGETIYFKNHESVINTLLSKNQVLVATDPDDSDILLGFICFDWDTLHYIACKRRWTKLGVARKLFRTAFPKGAPEQFFYSHHTDEVRNVPENWKYNPYASFL